jgi:hypothetical protein
MIARSFIAAILLSFISSAAFAQSQPAQANNWSVSITTGNTFQALLAAGTPRALTIENNNSNGDNCWIDVTGIVVATNTLSTSVTTKNGAITAQKATILLGQGASWQRYFSYVPNNAIVGTCATTGDSIYVEVE